MRCLWFIVVLSLFIGLVSNPSPTHAGDSTISTCDFASLSSAVTTANTGGGIVTFTCSGTIIFTTHLTITATVTLNENGHAVIFDDGGNNVHFFTVNAGASLNLNGFTLQNGYGSGGGAIKNFGATTINHTVFSANISSFEGGALYNVGDMTITDSTFVGNMAELGGAIENDTNLTIINSHFNDNFASLMGGALDNLGMASITNSTFTGNLAGIEGGGIQNYGTLMLMGSTFTDNIAPIAQAIATRLIGITTSQDSHYRRNTCDGTIADNGGNTHDADSVGCPGTEESQITVPVLGCALDTTDGVEVANTPDNTYCRVLMKNGAVVSYSGAVPANLIQLGVILAVDVYRLGGNTSVNTFPDYSRVCLAGSGKLFYMDSRNTPRIVIELATEAVDGLTCGWIPAPGTLILTS